MIGHYLSTLTEEQEDRILLRPMRARGESLRTGACLVITAQFVTEHNCEMPGRVMHWPPRQPKEWPLPNAARRYDDLCDRFGAPRVNAAIRNRILSNRARRILGNAVLSVPAPQEPQV